MITLISRRHHDQVLTLSQQLKRESHRRYQAAQVLFPQLGEPRKNLLRFLLKAPRRHHVRKQHRLQQQQPDQQQHRDQQPNCVLQQSKLQEKSRLNEVPANVQLQLNHPNQQIAS